MRLFGKLAVIGFGYIAAVAAGALAVVLNEASIPADTSQASGGMVAFGDLVLFVFVTVVIALVPSWFLLRLMFGRRKRPR